MWHSACPKCGPLCIHPLFQEDALWTSGSSIREDKPSRDCWSNSHNFISSTPVANLGVLHLQLRPDWSKRAGSCISLWGGPCRTETLSCVKGHALPKYVGMLTTCPMHVSQNLGRRQQVCTLHQPSGERAHGIGEVSNGSRQTHSPLSRCWLPPHLASCQSCALSTMQLQHLWIRWSGPARWREVPEACCFLPHDKARSCQLSGLRVLLWITKRLNYRQFPSSSSYFLCCLSGIGAVAGRQAF